MHKITNEHKIKPTDKARKNTQEDNKDTEKNFPETKVRALSRTCLGVVSDKRTQRTRLKFRDQ